MANFDAGVGGAAITEGGGALEIGQERIWINSKQQGRRTRQNLQPRNKLAASDHGETGGHDSGGTLG